MARAGRVQAEEHTDMEQQQEGLFGKLASAAAQHSSTTSRSCSALCPHLQQVGAVSQHLLCLRRLHRQRSNVLHVLSSRQRGGDCKGEHARQHSFSSTAWQ